MTVGVLPRLNGPSTTPRSDGLEDVARCWPLSFSQEAQLISDELRRYAKARPLPAHFPVALRSRGPLYFNALQAALDTVVHRHPGLRAVPPDDRDTNSYVEPRTPTERARAAVWQEVLGVNGVSVAGDFFALGGDSLNTLRVVLRAEEMGVSVTPEGPRQAPSLAPLACAINGRSGLDAFGSQPEETTP